MTIRSLEPTVGRRIPLCEPLIDGSARSYVAECLESGWVSSAGPFTERFERNLAAATGAARAVVTSSGTSALHASLVATGVGADDEVAVSALTFIAPANAIRYVGAWPVFIDADAATWQMDVGMLDDFLRRRCERVRGQLRNRSTGRRVAAILPVHILGQPCDLDSILALAAEFGLAVLEDATESLGAVYRGRPVGHHGVAGCLSFNGNKLITSGAGGAVLTDDDAFARRVRHLTTQARLDPLEYVHDVVGFNYRLSNLHAALGCAQLEGMQPRLDAKRRIHRTYRDGLERVPGLKVLDEAPGTRSAFWLTTVLVEPAEYGMDSRELLRRLALDGIETRPLWQPLHRSPAHADAQAADCPVAEHLQARALSLPSSPQLARDDQQLVIDRLSWYAGGR